MLLCRCVSCGLYAACETQKVAQEAKLAMLYNVAQHLAYFYPSCNSSTDSQIGCALLYNEETIPRCLNPRGFARQKQCTQAHSLISLNTLDAFLNNFLIIPFSHHTLLDTP